MFGNQINNIHAQYLKWIPMQLIIFCINCLQIYFFVLKTAYYRVNFNFPRVRTLILNRMCSTRSLFITRVAAFLSHSFTQTLLNFTVGKR